MSRLKSEQGYALVTVLVVIVVFMVISLSFMSQAFSSVKQNQVVEKRSRSVAAAEMGISYYQVEIQKTFESKQQLVSDYIRANSSLRDNFRRAAAVKMAAELQNSTIATPANVPYSMKNYVVTPDPVTSSNIVRISFNVVGNDNGKETTLFTEMSINFDSIKNQAADEVVTEKVLPPFNNIILTSGCANLDCNNVYINGNGNFSGNNNVKDNQTIYTTGSLILDGNGNENNITNVRIHTDGPISIHKNMNSASNILIETKGSAEFLQNVKISGTSKLLVNKTLYVNQHLELANNSFVFVGGTGTTTDYNYVAKIDNNLSIMSSSKMCVKGNLSAKDISVDSTSKLYVQGRVWVDGLEKFDYKVNNDADFISKCGSDVPVDFKIKWGDNVNTLINNVDYP